MKNKRDFLGSRGPYTIIIIAVLLVTVILILGFQSFKTTEKATLDEFNQRQLVLAGGATNGIELYFENLAGDMKALGEIQEVQSFDEAPSRRELQHTFNKIEHMGANDVGVLDTDGVLRYNVMAPQIEGMDFSWRDYFKELKDPTFTDEYVIEFIEFKGVEVGQKGVLIAVPMVETSTGNFVGVVLCTIKLDTVTNIFVANIKPSDGGHAFLMDDEYNMIWSPDQSLFGKNLMEEVEGFPAFQQVVEGMSAGQVGTSEYSYYKFEDQTGQYTKVIEEKLAAYAPIQIGTDLWSIGVWAPKEDARKLIRSAYLTQLSLLGLCILVIVLGGSYALVLSSSFNKQLQEDITKRKKAEEKLREIQELDDKVLEGSPVAFVLHDRDLRIVKVSQAYEGVTAYAPEEVLGRRPEDFMPEGSPKKGVIERLKKVRDEGVKLEPMEILAPTREERYLLETILPIFDSKGEVSHILAVLQDITDHKRADEALQRAHDELELRVDDRTAELKESEEKYRTFFELSPEAIVLLDASGKVLDLNNVVYDWLGYRPEEAIGKNISNLPFLPEVSRIKVKEKFAQRMAGKDVPAYELDFVTKDGERRIGLIHGTTLKDSDGKIIATLTMISNITERKKAEDQLRLHSEIMENMSEGVYLIRANDGTIVYTNPKFEAMFGYGPGEMIGKDVSMVNASDENDPEEIARDIIRKLTETGVWSGEVQNIKKDGTPFWCTANVSTFDHPKYGVVWVAIHTDITERKRAKKALKESEERFRTLFESTKEGIIITGPDGRTISANQAVSAMLGYESPEDLVGVHGSEMYYDPKQRDVLFAELMKKGFVNDYEVTFKKKDGTPVFIQGSATIHLDEEGKILRTEGIFRDITERKRAEEEIKRRLMRFRFEDGGLYLVKEDQPGLSLEAFNDLLKIGYKGFVISRTTEEEFNKSLDEDFGFYWLSERGGERTLFPEPTDIESIIGDMPRKAAILFDRLDYLVFKKGFEEILSFVQHLRELAYSKGGIIILSLDPSTLDKREIRLLEKETWELEPMERAKLPDGLLEVLRFLYLQNNKGERPSYTDVGTELKISRPTARKRIGNLVSDGYVRVVVKGNRKVLELSEKGRNIFSR